MNTKRRGQILIGVIVVMIILAIIIPAMVLYIQNEARWSVKQQQNMTAFQLAEAGVDRGYRKISESTTTWADGQAGVFPSGYAFNTSYSDLSGGCYAISISSGPEAEQVTIIAVSSESKKKEGRAISAVYANSPMGETAVRGQASVAVSGSNTQVHWGAIVTPQSLTVNGRTSPQMFSAGSIDLDTNSSTPPNCDQPNCWQWHSYETNIPATPDIDLGFYESSATTTSTYYNGNQSWGGGGCSAICNTTTACATGNVYYVNGNLTVCSSGIYVKGALIVTGNLILPNGLAGLATISAKLPRKAWMQYGNNWATYQPWDTGEPATFPGLNSSYLSDPAITVSLDKVIVEGFLYVGGNLTQGSGGGQEKVLGAAYVVGTTTVGANNFYIYYTEEAGAQIKTTNIILSRLAWKDLPGRAWPVGLSCP